MRIAEGLKCASDPHVVCALQYGSKSATEHRLGGFGAALVSSRCANGESISRGGPATRRETPPRLRMAGGDRVNRRGAQM